MPQTTQRFHSVSDSFHSRIDVWVFMMWPLWPSGSGHSGLCPPLPPPSGHKGHIIQPQTSILSWKLSLTSWKCWVVWVILLSNLLQPTRTIRMLPILSRNSSFRQKDPRKISFHYVILSLPLWRSELYACIILSPRPANLCCETNSKKIIEGWLEGDCDCQDQNYCFLIEIKQSELQWCTDLVENFNLVKNLKKLQQQK